MKRYGSATVVDDLSVAIAPGECLGVIGPSGAGKTTPIRLCLGLTAPDAGGVTASGLQMPRDALAIKPQLGVLSQMDTLDPDFSCAGNLLVYGRYFGMRAALAHKANAKPGELSGGMKRRLSLARALVSNTRLLLVYAVAAFRVALALTRNRFAKQRLLRRAARNPPRGQCQWAGKAGSTAFLSKVIHAGGETHPRAARNRLLRTARAAPGGTQKAARGLNAPRAATQAVHPHKRRCRNP